MGMIQAFTKITIIACLALGAGSAGAVEFMSGDVILHRSSSGQANAIVEATGAPYTHTGIIEVAADGSKWVIESTSPVAKRTPLSSFIGRSVGGRYTVLRYPARGFLGFGGSREMNENERQKIVQCAKAKIGTPYDPFFRNGLYCSKLIKECLGVGKVERLGDLDLFVDPSRGKTFLNLKPVVRDLIKRRGPLHPDCRGLPYNLQGAETCLRRISSQALVTPTGLVTGKFKTVFNNFNCSQVPEAVCQNLR